MVFRFKPFRKLVNGATPSLKFLTKTFLGVDIQSGEHCSVSIYFLSYLIEPIEMKLFVILL